MDNLSAKQQNERNAFSRFVHRLGEQDKWLNICCRPEPEPDLLCTHDARGFIAFELVSLTDPEIAKIEASGSKATQEAFSTLDPTVRIIRKKLHKNYVTDAPIELLVYTDGQIITPDDQIIPTILPWLDAVSHPFSRVWFMGQFETCCLWSAEYCH